MKFVHKATGQEVKRGDKVHNRGHPMLVSAFTPPTSPASSGRIYVVHDEHELERAAILGQGFFPSVFDCEWIEREDRE